ncbi:bifunctional [glutamate--ammonia ligase]-adenylyl-L-tyrosine phosphorylase/[glutamate--ammonia-ligase] adenylyltransferase [Pelomonas aquatica]|jgi:glutamate-ammonia-ligase adenylyltransferase|uniref:Bifunctional glutamine synthetase adenylyltransferase/adenylyl-removing enzyme n=1 Tax=Pelomonas aquatica TaxID=431058 RepID=A0A9X4LJA2_9BURK|nr:bifunctional [glutamate--ammonia ligase]-adenylyl-L-tyrosine phosphorylase/[glutamate--ammonia-ligase] adenylyltransferase [Pelomonas aquatica]MCY4756381.1 bifunctional [glutamate--ammonia ligase]-adenylyl-L-tyrosine phosphorylase/[glutamate--ammonia-ligase] adenylyltransferase [Pelomonas aquatica]MDG0864605.1 bifunctional [glutamate--ammonia ligase]-adenylyl-L-tyrosine phosphorylase/[glutamate--ammonia-ligase] adenylyltransferase [Pelomonas aquatica]
MSALFPVVAEHSRYVQRVRRRYGAELALLPPGLPDRAAVAALIDTLAADRPLASTLRVARHLVLERLAVLDIEQGASVTDVTLAMTHLAEVTLDIALRAARAELDAIHGEPRTADGQDIAFWVLGMGKLGARELNVSSDIDLIYVYEDDGATHGSRPVTAHEYFSSVARRLYALIGDVTDDGQVFRVDLALRPNGKSGPPVVSLAMLEEYFFVQGREWERFAWLKSRAVAPLSGPGAPGDPRTLQLRHLVTPFVYRRYLDYGVFESLRQLHGKIRSEAKARAAGRPERANDVKLSRGGIREIEFIVQLLQVVRGGQFPEIRTRSTVKALAQLAAGGLMKPDTAQRLADAYVFLRRVEHRIQFLDDQQTHCLPQADADLAWIAASLGMQCSREACELFEKLGEVRELVATEFDALLHGTPQQSGGCRGGQCGGPKPAVDGEDFLNGLPPQLAAAVRALAETPRVQGLREESRQRLAKLFHRAAQAVTAGECSLDAALRFVDWVEPLLRRESYLALLVERPAVQQRLLRLLDLARWPMRYLMQHPGVIDELADPLLLTARFDRAAFIADLQDRERGWARSGEADEEALLDTLRRAHHAEVFRTLVRDVEGRITVEQVADDLSLLADAVLQVAIQWAWARFGKAHRAEPRLAVIAYGKLGGKELGYGGDLDVVFVFDDEDENAAEIYGAFVRRLITWLTLRTAAGELFDIDTALRPNGNSGLLVTSLAHFEAYQTGRGSNTAWTWEHQAITRARFCAGDADLAEHCEAVRRQVLTAPRDAEALGREVRAMREKVRAARPVREGLFDVKHSEGGMMDAEFALQTLVLANGADHPELLDNLGNIALLQRCEAVGLLPAGVGVGAANAYRELRRVQHKARLDEQSTALDEQAAAPLAPHRDAVRALWRAVFA